MTARRSTLLTAISASALTLAATFSLAGTSPAQAVPPTPTTFTPGPIIVGGPLPVAGQLIAESGVLMANGSPAAGEPVNLLVKRYGATSYALAGHGVTDSYGGVTLSIRLYKNATLKLVHPASAAYGASSTSPRFEYLSTRVFVSLSDTTPRVGQRVVFRGRTNPVKAGFTIALWSGYTSRGGDVYIPNPPVRLASVKVRSDGTYLLAYRFARAGHKHLYLEVARGAGNTTGWSRDLKPVVG